MGPMLRSELLKLRTTRTFVAMVAVATLLALLITTLGASLSDIDSKDDVRAFVIADTGGFFILILGIVGMAGEWRHKTITGTILANPDRIRLVAAKVVAYALAGVVLSLVANALAMTVATAILSARDLPTLDAAELGDLLWRNLLLAALGGALGVGIGGVIRNQTVAVTLVLAFAFSIEPALVGLAPEVGQFGPFTAVPTAFLGTKSSFAFGENAQLLAPWLALLVMVGWVAAFAVASALMLRRRDLT